MINESKLNSKMFHLMERGFFGKQVLNEDDAGVKYDAIFVAGLTREVSIDGQVEYFKKGFGSNAKVAAFDYNGVSHGGTQTIAQVLASNPKIPAFLFSKGCEMVQVVASNGNADVQKIFVIEPYYGQGQTVKPKIEAALGAGVPAKNVYVANYANAGKGVLCKPNDTNNDGLCGATATKSGNHYSAVTEVAGNHKQSKGFSGGGGGQYREIY
jgi:hypothetical protein